MLRILPGVLLTIISTFCYAQESTLSGRVTGNDGLPIVSVNISVENTDRGVATDANGEYSLNLPSGTYRIVFTHVRYQTVTREVDLQESRELNILMVEKVEVLEQVEVTGQAEREEASLTRIDPIQASELPSAFGDFSRVLTSLPGVAGNSELSTAYSVRGGNFDENLVYVNGIPVYRPFLVRAGRQEGLSFVNLDLVSDVNFSAGGWQPRFGDRLSSNLDIRYKTPEEFRASASGSLLASSLHLENSHEGVSYAVGARYKSSRYLFNTFETTGEYLPRFFDIQSIINVDLDPEGRNSISFLSSYARNRYFVEPENRETDFGAFPTGSFRLFVAFAGQELLEYDTYQGGLNFTHRTAAGSINVILSGVKAIEREYNDLEGGYRLCDLDNNPGSGSFNDCIFVRGIGTNYNYARNRLDAGILNAEVIQEFDWGASQNLSWGLGYTRNEIDDRLDEYAFVDSANFVSITDDIFGDNTVTSQHYTAFVQNTSSFRNHTLTYGVRLNYRDLNEQLLISPRIQYAFSPQWERDFVFKAAIGIYQQPPFYRELRAFDGTLNTDIEAQTSLHIIGGVDYRFRLWDRDFKFTGEAYYKHLTNVIPYDIDNMRIRYYGNNDAEAFATGIDLRVNGEFVPGTESWFSLGLLNTKENLENDSRGFIDRPTNQTVNLAIFFQDHIPNDPTIRVALSLYYGSGLPFGPPNDLDNRNIFTGEDYRRVDIGFSKSFLGNGDSGRLIENLTLGLDILNLLGVDNTITYTFIEDFSGRQFAVPNSLSSRFFNLWIKVHI